MNPIRKEPLLRAALTLCLALSTSLAEAAITIPSNVRGFVNQAKTGFATTHLGTTDTTSHTSPTAASNPYTSITTSAISSFVISAVQNSGVFTAPRAATPGRKPSL